MAIEIFVAENIKNINNRINDFKNNPEFNDISIKNYLKEKFRCELQEKKEKLLEELQSANYVKARIEGIANKYVYYKKDLESFYMEYAYKDILESIDTEDLSTLLCKDINSRISIPGKYNFIKRDLEKIAGKVILLLKMKGFPVNILGLNEGVMVANSGDSAQFLFLSRAILAGFNCSNVDVRSSRYDTIIDFNGVLLKVQVKGISDNTISFKDRDRGGQGIDYTHERNRGQIIASKDCDIYVAVDKQCGLCYIIPMRSYVDELPNNEKSSPINISQVAQYRENWNVIEEVAQQYIKV